MTPTLYSPPVTARRLARQTRTRYIRALTLLLVLILLHGPPSSGQVNPEVRFQSGSNRVESRYARGALSVVQHFSNGDIVTESASVSDLDLENVTSGDVGPEPGRFYASLPCKHQRSCVSKDVPACAIVPGCRTQQTDNIEIACNSLTECAEFVQALKQEQVPKPCNPESRTTQAKTRSMQSSASQTPDPKSVGQPATANPLQDILASIGWLSNPNGSGSAGSALDNLLQKITPAQSPVSKSTQVPRPTFAAFSQAGGFDANGAWGIGTGSDLNSAVGQAGNTCHARAQSVCDDEGYCIIRAGLWSAWASDLKVAGNTAFACNLASEAEARARAQAWCGDSCKVIWAGAGQ
jgi:hypothetical protein